MHVEREVPPLGGVGDGDREVALTEWTLTMRARARHDPAPPHPGLRVERARVPSYELSHALYSAVGVTVCWTDRRTWDYDAWHEWVADPRLELWIATVDGTPAGFCELLGHDDAAVEIVLFGLIPTFRGVGVGGPFLSACIEAAWRYDRTLPGRDLPGDTSRVFLVTSTLDHPHALKNYLARGFELEHSEKWDKRVPDPRVSVLDLPFDPRDDARRGL
ncbi:GNAT family N-acetyltransferase [Rhodococcus sp. HNM0569]|uniref:GNAT family N-acetyltransferase n=1 Tax=Rhodococcus sp. HNM0569 TaxID=2716340 RepID=UPI00146F73E3|nr:GNAT family N-acetyltransferase [Rhodococcus sp. HNM0569]NLU82173.1 GNAT family N-acetyltransferase [Rhodococcus sp. HNM0569]